MTRPQTIRKHPLTSSWKLIENIHDMDVSFRVDPIFLKLPLAGKASSLSDERLRYIARRTLEVAIARATDAVEEKSEARKDVQTVRRLADNAQRHVVLLIRNLLPPTQSAKRDEYAPLAETLLSVLAGSDAPVTTRRRDADKLARTLVATTKHAADSRPCQAQGQAAREHEPKPGCKGQG